MVLVTKHNVTVDLLESICGDDAGSGSFLLQTPKGIRKFKLRNTINTHGTRRHETGMIVLRGQGPYLVFCDDLDTALHGDVTELVEYIKTSNYAVVTIGEL